MPKPKKKRAVAKRPAKPRSRTQARKPRRDLAADRSTIWLGTVAGDGPVELFPDPASVFAPALASLADRAIPVARFDLSLLGRGLSGPAIFFWIDDVRSSSFRYTVAGGRVTRAKADFDLRPASEPIDGSGLAGRRAALEEHRVTLGPPDDSNDWQERFESELIERGARRPLQRLRLGGYPCFVQSSASDDDPSYLGELPGDFLGLDSRVLYLHTEDGRSFWQGMEMS